MSKRKINQLSLDGKLSLTAPSPFIKYEPQILYFLNHDTGNRDLDDIKKNYVEDGDTLHNLRKILKDSMDSVTTFIGYRGIGKTTDIRYVYSVWNNAIKFWDEESTIIIPFFFSSAVETDNFDIRTEFGKRIDAVCEAIISRNDLKCLIPEYRKTESTQELYHFLSETNPKAMIMPGFTSKEIKDKLSVAEQNDFFIYAATRLKYYMSKISHKYQRLLLILDGAESLPEPLRIPVVAQSIQVRKCLMNYPDYCKRKYNVNLLLSLQPCTYQEAKSKGVIMPANTLREIYKTNRLNLQKYFNQKRSSISPSLIEKEPESWKSAYGILRSLSDKFEGKYANMILGLTNLDIPMTLNVFREILSNSLWMTKRDDDTYIFNNIRVIRAIACGAREVYFNKKDSLIPNILYNTEQHDYSIICLYIISYFTSKSVDYLEYGDTVENKQTVIDDLCRIFGYNDKDCQEYKEFTSHIDEAISYLCQCGILETINFNSNQNKTPLSSGQKLLLSAKGNECFKMLRGDSMLTELFREDYYMEEDSNDPKQFQSSQKLMDENDQISVFIELLIFLYNLFDKHEAPFINRMQSQCTQGIYTNTFGGCTMTELLLDGINKSINYSGNWGVTSIIDEEEKLISKIEEVFTGHTVQRTLQTVDNH
ncbi:MAG: hypothetical protein HDQ99_10645 [Lachnospiraceae bacterium]|nr:hypothetical protein [Lachnospiraceae bacterium]